MSTLKLIATAALIASFATPAFAQKQPQRRAVAVERAAPFVLAPIPGDIYGDRVLYLSQHQRNVSQVHEFHRVNAAGGFGRR
jgi:hypothetical protein